jgi:hypothetical protein
MGNDGNFINIYLIWGLPNRLILLTAQEADTHLKHVLAEFINRSLTITSACHCTCLRFSHLSHVLSYVSGGPLHPSPFISNLLCTSRRFNRSHDQCRRCLSVNLLRAESTRTPLSIFTTFYLALDQVLRTALFISFLSIQKHYLSFLTAVKSTNFCAAVSYGLTVL